MITNENQFKITRKQMERLQEALDGVAEVTGSARSNVKQRIQSDALRHDIARLRHELDEYEELRSGKISRFSGGFEELPEMLIKARIARGMTQKDLAEKLSLKTQQIQRYESTGYASVSFSRMGEVKDALGVVVTEDVTLLSKNG